jgi:pimeloyl-ACP methyl ester carboxylesterase
VPGTEAVDRLRAPILLVHGDSDGVLPDLCSRNVYERATSARSRDLVVLPGEGHLLDGPAAAGLDEQLATFLQAALVAESA